MTQGERTKALILEVLRKRGTEPSVSALLTHQKSEDVNATLSRHAKFIAKMLEILEDRGTIRRGHVVAMVCASEGIPDGGSC